MPDQSLPDLRRFTMARVGLRRAGNSIATRDLLDFQLAHAHARDAVHGPFDPAGLALEIEAAGFRHLLVSSAAKNRHDYLRRPDLGRRLDDRSREALRQAMTGIDGPYDVIFIIADGLSPMAVQIQAAPLLRLLAKRLDPAEWRIAPVVIATQARVALSDEIGSIVQASLAVMMIGERPGLSSFDSMGAYLTWSPLPGRTDADRNCISNIHSEGLALGPASELLLLLMQEMRVKRLSGVDLRTAVT